MVTWPALAKPVVVAGRSLQKPFSVELKTKPDEQKKQSPAVENSATFQWCIPHTVEDNMTIIFMFNDIGLPVFER